MDVPFQGLDSESETEACPLLMDRHDSVNSGGGGGEHVINIPVSESTSSGVSNNLDSLRVEDRSSSNGRTTSLSIPSTSNGGGTGINTRNGSYVSRRGETRTRRRSPLNSGLWISIELALTMSQIVASIIVLSVSRNEHPRAPLFEWIVGYAIGCVATLPLLYWRYHHRNQTSEPDAVQSRNGSSRVNGGSFSVTRNSEAEDQRPAASQRSVQSTGALSARYELFEYLYLLTSFISNYVYHH